MKKKKIVNKFSKKDEIMNRFSKKDEKDNVATALVDLGKNKDNLGCLFFIFLTVINQLKIR